VGGNLLRRLQLTQTPWVELHRSNRTNLDPIYFGVYHDIVYHHGAGFRGGDPSGVHRMMQRPPPWSLPVPMLTPLVEGINRKRWRRWERTTQRRRIELSAAVYEEIRAGGREWLAKFI
jgi:hypothetical protein